MTSVFFLADHGDRSSGKFQDKHTNMHLMYQKLEAAIYMI